MVRLRFSSRYAGRVVACATLLLTVACQADHSAAPPPPTPPAEADVTSGAGQTATAGEALPQPIEVTVLDKSGGPIRGVGVDWEPQDSGQVSPAHSSTREDGVATTVWTLGPVPGDHTVLATVAGYGPLEVHANAAPAPLVINTVHLLSLETPDGSGQTVHPDFVNVTEDSPLKAEFLAITPYPFGNALAENPSVYTSLDRVHWAAPDGGTNPVALPETGYLSDPDMVYNPVSDELWLYYREVDAGNEIRLTKSSDGTTWSDPKLVVFGLRDYVVSPTVVRRSENEWLMWAVNGQSGCEAPDTWVELRKSTDGETWGPPERVSLTQPGFTPWHIDVQWIPSRAEYWAVYNVKIPQSCSTPALYLATSPDGITWKTYQSPVLARGDIDDLQDIVYRSTFRYRPETDAITFWYSGAKYDGFRYTWNSAVQRRQRTDVFAAINRPVSASLTARLRRHVPPLLTPP